MGQLDTGRIDALLCKCLGSADQAVARHDNPVVRGDEVLLGAVDDRPHAFLQGGVLHGDTFDSAIGVATSLRRAIDEVVIVLVGDWPIGTGNIENVNTLALSHRIALGIGQTAGGVKIIAPGPAILVVDRNPEVDRKSTRLNSSHRCISYAVFCSK